MAVIGGLHRPYSKLGLALARVKLRHENLAIRSAAISAPRP
jgi:hypothetical protein